MPAFKVIPPVVVPITPLRARVPVPALVMPKVAPVMPPPTVSVLPFTVMMRAALRTTAPVPRFSGLLPVKAKSPFQFIGLLAVSVMAAPEVLSIVPLVIIKVLPVAPSAVTLLMFKVPAVSVVLPV